MIRTVLSIAFLFAILATAPDAFSAEPTNEDGKKSTQCEKGQCTASALQVIATAGQERTNTTCSGLTCSSKSCDTTTVVSKTCTAKVCPGESCATKACTAKACDKKECASELVTSEACAGNSCASKACTGEQCPAGSCKSTEGRLVKAAEKVDSVKLSACQSAKRCGSEPCSQKGTDCTSCPADELAGTHDPCEGCPMMLSSTATASPCCGCGSDCSCSTDAEQKAREDIAALHARLVQQSAENAALASQLQTHEALAKAKEDFCTRLLEKEIEVVKLKAELQIAEQRSKLTQEIAEAVVACERFKASLELANTLNENLKTEMAEAKSHQAQALADSKAEHAKLTQRIAALEEKLESINMQLATKPGDSQLK